MFYADADEDVFFFLHFMIVGGGKQGSGRRLGYEKVLLGMSDKSEYIP